jgi:hypothetical protein
VAVTVRATIAPARYDDLARTLEVMRAEGAARNSVLPFGGLAGVHFARLFLLPGSADLDGGPPLPACLVYMADVDAPVYRHLRDLANALGPGTDLLFGHCEDYPTEPSPGTRLAWLLERMVAPAASYVHRVGRTVAQVHEEHRLRDAVESYLDPPDAIPAQLTAVEAHGRIRSFALRRDDLRWARLGPRGTGLAFRVRDLAHLVALPLLVWLVDETDPLVGRRSSKRSYFTAPARPVRRRYNELPQFVHVRGGAYFFLPGIRALRFLAMVSSEASAGATT